MQKADLSLLKNLLAMAISISGLSASPLFTAQFDNIVITSDDEAVNISIAVDGSQIFSQDYFTYNSLITLRNINTLIEQHMRENSLILASVTISTICDSDDPLSKSQTVIFCESLHHAADPVAFISANFLTDATSARVPSDAIVSLSAVLTPSETRSASILATFRSADEILTTESALSISADSATFAPVTFNKQISDLCPAGATLLSATFILGDRSFTYYIDDTPIDICLAFHNRFNAPEIIPIHAVTTHKISVDRTLANLGSYSKFYDRLVTKTFDTEAQNLPFSLALHLEQLLSAPFVGLVATWNDIEDGDISSLPEILITDFSSDPQPGDDELNTLKFSWRFADTRRHAISPISERIFTSPFSNQFS
jgi:hypothetical protein